MMKYLYGIFLFAGVIAMNDAVAADEPLMDWSLWEKYRRTAIHPSGYINAQDLENARENIKRYEWARKYAESVEKGVLAHMPRFTDEFLVRMIPATSMQICHQCPACRDKKLPAHPGGAWTWTVDSPEVITCKLCKTVFPNDQYPETIVLTCKSEKGRGQTLTYYGGDTFKQWGYAYSRPSFTCMVRSQKVGWCKGMAGRFALAYALTGKVEYAELVRKILLRFAEVYPNWLLVSSYGETADMDPHIAGLCLNDLPEDELVYPPNKPDRKIYTAYWMTGRVGGGGMEGASFTRPMLQAYEFTCTAKRADGTPVYTEDERIKIERDVLMESCIHLIGEKRINNKSVGNRIAVAMVGMAVGHPGFVRFGLEGWDLTMTEWFLADGCTPESPAYAMMSLGGIYPLAQAIRGYSDPPGYVDEKGKRIENLNLYEGKYKLVWQRMFEGMQGNLYFPPYADSYRTSAIGTVYVELLAGNYPDNPQHLALMKEIAGDDLTKGSGETALFFREPGLEKQEAPPLHFGDDLFPILCLGQARTGEHGRRSLALLSATHWGGHHHSDSLNLYYWKDGHELLSDLGYLWDHPMSKMTRRTFAHNTGMVDLAEQKTKDRGGHFHLFHVGQRVKVMEASSSAYDMADVYRRTVVQIDHAPDNSYLVDIFRLRAPGSRDLVYHGPNSECQVSGIELKDGVLKEKERLIRFGLRFHLDRAGREIFVDDVSIKLKDGTEVAVNPSANDVNEAGKPLGWNHYTGDGAAEWGSASPGRDDERCAHLKVTRQSEKGGVNQALIHGDTNGYTGEKALQMPDSAEGTVTFWIKGKVGVCDVGMVLWRSDPTSAADRQHVPVISVPATDQWVRHTAEFSMRNAGMDLANVRSARSPAAWQCRWTMAKDLQFTVRHMGQEGEVVYVGDGWGQRDYRNTDLGVTIPYIIRRHEVGQRISVFGTVYEAHEPDKALVESVLRLSVPSEQADSAVSVAVKTRLGTDIIISQLQPTNIDLETPVGKVRTDAAAAVLSMREGKPAFSALAGGKTLALDGRPIDAQVLAADGELDDQAAGE
ncbi:MAG: heparinase II/III family protein [Planctomycetota bacterium]